MDEDEAFQRYYVIDLLPQVAAAAHAQGLTVEANIEALAHILNRAGGEGIGADDNAVQLAGNLPPPSVNDVLAFLDDVIATGADRIFAEAFDPAYDIAIARHLADHDIPYLHTGPDLGNVWVGYHYALYPDTPASVRAYQYLYTDDALLGATNSTVFARARAVGAETAVVVGAYLPLPCDPTLSVADLYAENRRGGTDAIDADFPALADGTPVANCTTELWRNLLLIAARRQHVGTLRLTSDLEASVAATLQDNIGSAIRARLAAHPAVTDSLPVANIVLDIPEFGEDDGFTGDEFLESVSITTLGVVDDALSAAGYETVLTYNTPWEGCPVALTYIVTAGGNEDTDDGRGMGPPYWSDAQDLDPALLAILDPRMHPGPVLVHPILGIPDSGNWRDLRERFGLPQRFAFRNPALSDFVEYHTSLLTSVPVDADGETPDGAPWLAITPPEGDVLGVHLRLTPYVPTPEFGQVANLLGPDDAPADRIFARGHCLRRAAPRRRPPTCCRTGRGASSGPSATCTMRPSPTSSRRPSRRLPGKRRCWRPRPWRTSGAAARPLRSPTHPRNWR